MKELATKILKLIKPELWVCYSEEIRETYISELTELLQDSEEIEETGYGW